MNGLIKIGNQEISVKEFEGKRVVTFMDIDMVHERPEGTARKRFNDNKKHFIEGEDYFVRKTDEAKSEFDIVAPNGLVLLTESGYLMLVKSLKDDLAWQVQRQLVKSYFTVKEFKSQELSPQLQLLINMELEQKRQAEKLEEVEGRMDSIREVIALSPTQWRKDTSNLINKIALSMGGYEHIRAIREESYKLLEQRMGVALSIRLTNKRKTMALNGICKSKLDKLNQLDVIADDKKLIEGYIAIVKELAIKYGTA